MKGIQHMCGINMSSLSQDCKTKTIARLSLGLQIAQSRSYLWPFGPKVGSICILGAIRFV